MTDEITYIDYKGDEHKVNWLDILELYFKAVWMRQSVNDKTCIRSILEKVRLN